MIKQTTGKQGQNGGGINIKKPACKQLKQMRYTVCNASVAFLKEIDKWDKKEDERRDNLQNFSSKPDLCHTKQFFYLESFCSLTTSGLFRLGFKYFGSPSEKIIVRQGMRRKIA